MIYNCDFGDTLVQILRRYKKKQPKQRLQYGELYKRNCYKEVKEKNRVHYKLYSLDGTIKDEHNTFSL